MIKVGDSQDDYVLSSQVEYNGEIHSIKDWAKIIGINKYTLRHRFNSGWSIDEALTTKPNLGNKKFTHYMSHTNIWYCHKNMKDRCYNKNHRYFNDYGGRGIKVCDEWLNKDNGFKNFYEWALNNGYCDGMTLDRINVNGNYEPNNCRWVDWTRQANNRRNNVFLTYNGLTGTICDWARFLKVPKYDLYNRRYRGMNDSQIIDEILKQKGE